MMTAEEIRQKFLAFFEQRGHKIVPSASLIPTDPSVLLTTAGMQPFKDYYLNPAAAEKDFGGVNVASVQKCFRTSDLDEVGDETHLTFFEMLGNFSFGGYFKQRAIELAHEFITHELGLKIDYVTIFAGDDSPAGGIPKDEESKKIWQKLGLTDIRAGGRTDNFWGPTGTAGPCGPTTEIYVHGVEVWNLVFNEYYCRPNGQFEKLSTPGVDTGMGLERLTMIVQKKNNLFETDLFTPLLEAVALPDQTENDPERTKRIVADHYRAIVFLIADGVRPSNKGAGYVLRRLLRRLIAISRADHPELINLVLDHYQARYEELKKNHDLIVKVVTDEYLRFSIALNRGLEELKKLDKVDAKTAFQLYETYGLPFEAIKDRRPELTRADFEKEMARHQQVSRAGLAKKFAGGLADHEPATIRLHTAHHLLLAALQQVFGKQLKQRGSNINQERLRLDFTFDRKLTVEETPAVEKIVNEKIAADRPVIRKEMPRAEAETLGAEKEFGQKYGETVAVYFIEDENGKMFSAEFCGGPHATRTGELGRFKIIKDEAVAAGIRRIKATLD